jgi:hypothetical protein
MHASLASSKQVALEVGEPDARSLTSAGGAEPTPDNVFQIVSVDLPSSSYDVAPPNLGLPSFLSNLQVTQLLCSIVPPGKLSSLYSFVFDRRLWLTDVCSVEVTWCHYPRRGSASDAVEPIAASKTDS